MKKTLKKCFLLILPLVFLALTTTNFMSRNAYADIQKSDKCFQLSIKRTIKNSDEEPTIAKTGEICAINLTPDGKIKKPGTTDGQYDPGTTFTTKNPESNISGFGITFKAITPSSGPGLASRIEVDCDPAYNSTGGCGSITISDGMSWSDVESNMRGQIDSALNLKNQANLTFEIIDEEGSGTGQTGSKYGDRQAELRKLAGSCKQQYQDQVNKSPDDELTNDVGSPFNGRVNVEHKAGNATDNFIDAWLVETTNENGEGTGEYDCYPLEGFEKPDLSEIRTNLNISDEEEDEEEKNCFNSGGAQSLGWIVCPIMTWMSDAAEEIYNNFVKPSLNVEPSLFTGTDTGARVAWSAFRDIANVCFIIVALVVIFSQVTGVGIDNYGIKKILPKLVVVAVLVNLSYVLCEACVDLSNILGNALQSMLEGFPSGSPPPDNPYGIDNFAFDTFETVAIIAAFFVGGLAVWDNPAIVLSLFIGLLGVIISILFLFLLLAARQAAIVVLVVISPLAAICYALPNTKPLADKWIKFFKGLLVVYPIAGLLVGGGDFVSELLLSSGFGDGGFFTAFMAMVVGIVPIFFIPTALKSSFAAMGNIGAKISGMGNQLSHAATRGIRGTEAYKNAQASSIQRRTRHKAGLKKDGKTPNARGRLQQDLLSKAKNGGRGSMLARGVTSVLGTDSHLNRNRRQFLKDNEANNDANSLADPDNFNRAVAQQQAEFDKQAVAAVESQMALGFQDENGQRVSANDRKSVARFHKDQLAAANDAQNRINQANSIINSNTATSSEKRQASVARTKAQEDFQQAITNVKAAQNNLMQSDGGREAIMNHYDEALTSGHTGGLQEAASHLVSEHSGTLKASSQGDNEMALNLANANDSNGGVQDVVNKNNSGYYATFGAEKYDSDSLPASDNRTLEHFADAAATVQSGSDVAAIAAAQEAAAEALQRNATGELAISGEKKDKLQRMVTNRHVFEDANGDHHVAYAVNSGNGPQYYDAHGGSVNVSGWTRI